MAQEALVERSLRHSSLSNSYGRIELGERKASRLTSWQKSVGRKTRNPSHLHVTEPSPLPVWEWRGREAGIVAGALEFQACPGPLSFLFSEILSSFNCFYFSYFRSKQNKKPEKHDILLCGRNSSILFIGQGNIKWFALKEKKNFPLKCKLLSPKKEHLFPCQRVLFFCYVALAMNKVANQSLLMAKCGRILKRALSCSVSADLLGEQNSNCRSRVI